MKVIAMYLPQFHKVPENDRWWGEGFTDWVSAKEAKPLYEGHYQPHIPLNNNYYDLMDKKTMEWQTDLMHKYGVDGMCMYHYWFENGRRILEKPAENLLKWQDIDMPFCFSWANETWARSWANIKDSNTWSNVKESPMNQEKILLNQNYGDVHAWKEHFEYLCRFFQDERYIKIDGKPVFLIYRVNLVDCLQEMLECWRKWSLEKGFKGLYIIGSNLAGNELQYLDAELYHEPLKNSRNLIENDFTSYVKRIEYKDVWENIINQVPQKRTFYGGFVGYDDTPRRGTEGLVVENTSPQMFGKYLKMLMKKNAMHGNDITFINAWNEWGEGMHLEPDSKYGYNFLEQIPIAKKNYQDVQLKETRSDEHNNAYQQRASKFEMYLNDLDRWMTLKENGYCLAELLLDMGIHNLAIYGFGIMGRHFKAELQNSTVECKYVIDKQKEKIHTNIEVYLPDEQLPNVDAIVVCAYYYLSDIKVNCNCPIISLGDLIRRGYNNLDF